VIEVTESNGDVRILIGISEIAVYVQPLLKCKNVEKWLTLFLTLMPTLN